MDSGLARFALLIVLFFLLTGDLAGMLKHLFEEAAGGGGRTVAEEAKAADKGTAAAAAGPLDGEDPDLESFGKRTIITPSAAHNRSECPAAGSYHHRVFVEKNILVFKVQRGLGRALGEVRFETT